MVNPYEVGYLVAVPKKADFDKVSAAQFTDPSRPIIVDVGSAQGRFLSAGAVPSECKVVGFISFCGL